MATLVDAWDSWTPSVSLAQLRPTSQITNQHGLGKRNRVHRDPDNFPGSSEDSRLNHRHNQTMVPGTNANSRHGSRVLVCSPSSTTIPGEHPCPPRSGGANDNPPLSPSRQLTSSLTPTPQNQLPFPSLSLPSPPDFSAMLAILPENPLRRTNKMRRPNRISANPPVLAPLSFIEEPELELDFEQISHDVQHTSSHPLCQSLTNDHFPQQDAPSPELCEHAPRYRLTKRQMPSLTPIPQEKVVSSSSRAAAAAAVTGNPAAPIASGDRISSHSSSNKPHRARSENGHGLRHSVSIKRASIIRRLSTRTPKLSFESQTTSSGLSSSTGPTTPVSPTMGVLSRWRGAVSEVGHESTKEGPPISLPLVRVTSPLSIHMPSIPNADDIAPRVSMTAVRTDSRPCSPTLYESLNLSNPISDDSIFARPRAKFTLEGNESEAEMSNPPSPILGTTMPTYFTPHHSAPPSRTQSDYNPQFLSPLSRPEPGTRLPPRRWTFAMAMMDDDITDEVLVEELERMRLHKEWNGSVDDMDDIWDPDYVLFGTFGSQELTDSPQEEFFPQRHLLEHSEHNLRHSQPSADLSYTPSLPSFPHQHRNNSVPLPDTGSTTQQWQTARKVLLTCRELVRTERHYLASLKTLLASETESAPPALMLRYVEELVKVSQSYVAQMEGNPSSWGVAAAFLGVEEAIDQAFVGWCSEVGTWFDSTRDDAAKTESRAPSSYARKPSKQNLRYDGNKENEKRGEEETTMGRLRRIGSWKRSLTSISDMTMNAPNAKKEKSPPPSFSLYGLQQRRNSSKVRKPLIRDLAILPTQRIMRYALLYRDLLAHTPSTSPSRGLIKRAADIALRIAQKCDCAQTNSAFIVDKHGDDKHGDNNTTPSAVTPRTEGNTDLYPSISKRSTSATGTP